MNNLAVIVPIWKEPRHILEQNLRVWKGYNVYWILNFQDVDTVCLAQELGANIIISYSKCHLKGNMLNTAMRKIKEEYVCVFDVDDYPSEGYVETLLKHLKANKEIACVTGQRVMHNEHDNILTENQNMEQQLWNYVLKNMLVKKSGGWFPLVGSGFIIRREDFPVLWEGTTTEDADFTIQLMQKNKRIAILDNVFYAECPTSIIPIIRQRARWNKGILQCLIHYPDLFKQNKLLFISYVWVLYSIFFTVIKLTKYPILFILPIPMLTKLVLLFIFLFEEFEMAHWKMVETQGLLSRKNTYSMIVLNIVNIAVPFAGLFGLIFSPKYWYCTPKQGVNLTTTNKGL